MRGIARHKDAAGTVTVGQGKTQIPEAHALELQRKLGADGFVQHGLEVVVVSRGAQRNRGVKKPGVAQVHTAKELPITFQVRVQHVVKRLAGVAGQQLVEFLRFKHQQHHETVVVGERLCDARLFARFGAAAIATHRVSCMDNLCLLRAALHQRDGGAVCILRDGLGIPTEQGLYVGQHGEPLTQHALGLILRQAFVGGEVIGLDQFSLQPVVAVVPQQRAVGRQSTDAVLGRDGAGGS